MGKNGLYAVLTGDLVDSGKYPVAKITSLFASLFSIVNQYKSTKPGHVIGSLCVFQGDKWQVLLGHTSAGIEMMILLSAACRRHGMRTRCSLGVGTVELICEANITESQGEAFVFSGRGLDALERRGSKKQFWAFAGEGATASDMLLFAVLGDIASGWTVRQAELVPYLMQGKTHEEIAGILDLKRQSVSKSAIAGKWDFFSRLMQIKANV